MANTAESSQRLDQVHDAVAAQHEAHAFDWLSALVSFPSVAQPEQFGWEGSIAASDWLVARLHELGFDDAHSEETVDGSRTVLAFTPGPKGAPTVLLYAHYDVQPPLDEAAWKTPPFQLAAADDGRWYGRGAADCKGNIVAHLEALHALRTEVGELPVGVRVVIEGSEEQGGAGLDDWLAKHPQDFDADVMLIVDSGNMAVGQPTLNVALRGVADVRVEVRAFDGSLHSGEFGGAVPDALAALIAMLATLRDRNGDTVIPGVLGDGHWDGAGYPPEQLRSDARVLDGVSVIGSGSVADQLWARPAVTVLGIDVPSIADSTASIQGRAAARLNLRVPPQTDPRAAADALVAHLRSVAPWGVRVTAEVAGVGAGFRADTSTRSYALLVDAMEQAFGVPVTFAGSGGAIPLTAALSKAFPQAEVALFGVEEPRSAIHAPNESVDPNEILRVAQAEAGFLVRLGSTVAER